MTYNEMKKYLREFNKTHDFTTESINGYVVITQDSFNAEYTEEERTYEVSSDNKAFIPNMLGYSIYGNCLDGKDRGVRMDNYLEEEHNGGGWKVERCYIKDIDGGTLI